MFASMDSITETDDKRCVFFALILWKWPKSATMAIEFNGIVRDYSGSENKTLRQTTRNVIVNSAHRLRISVIFGVCLCIHSASVLDPKSR